MEVVKLLTKKVFLVKKSFKFGNIFNGYLEQPIVNLI